MKDNISRIKEIMTDVATGASRIQEKNDSYIKLYKAIDDYCTKHGIKNPNPYSDLWEFYHYWSNKLPRYTDRRVYIVKLYKQFQHNQKTVVTTSMTYVDLTRIEELKREKSINYDLRKLVKLCEEINVAYNNNCYLTVIILLRTILNHIPPVFGCNTFKEVSSQFGKKSFKDIAKKLEDSSRKIADSYLHDPIRKKENLPNKTQVNFSQELDYILAEIISIN